MTKHLRFLIVLLMTLVWSAGWAAESVYKTLSFPDDNKANNKVQVYTSTWTAKIGSDSWSIVNFNNNKWENSWTYIKCGNKGSASIATLTNTTAFDKAITKVVVNASKIKSVSNINSIKLETSKQANFSSIAETVTLEENNIKQGNLTFKLSAPIENGYYRLTFDCQKTSKTNTGNVQVDQVEYYINDSKTSTTLTFPQQSLIYATTDDLTSFTGQTATLTADGTALTGKTITYSKSGDDIFSSFDTTNGTLALNGNAGTATVTATFDGSNDDTYASSSASYEITVKEVIKDIATLKEKLTTSYQYFTLKLTDAIVTYKSGNTLYLQDKTGGIYCSGTTTLADKDKVNGLVNIRARVSNRQRTITQFTLAEGATIENNVEFTPEVVTLAQLNDNIDKYENMRVKVVAATATAAMNNNQTTITQDGASLVLYSKNTLIWDFVADDVLDIEGYPVTYTNSSNTLKELLVYKKSDVEINSSVVATTLSFDTETTAFNVEKNSESSFVAPKAVVKDAKGNVVEGAKITYVSDAPTIASVAENGNVTFGSAFGTATITASYAGDDTHKPATSIFYTITYSKIPTEMAWSESSVSVNIGQQPSLPTLTLTAHGEDILAGKTITYSSSDESLVSIDEFSGKMHIDAKAGSTTITATFVGDDTYAEATAKYTLNVIDPNKTDVTFDFTKPENYGYAKPASGKATELSDGDKLVSNEVIITNVKGNATNKTRFFNSSKGVITFRIYSGAILTVEAPAGFAINRIDFIDSPNGTKGFVKNFTFSTGELKSSVWAGLAEKLTMEVPDDQVFLENMTVNLVKVENVTLNESEINTIEAKALANVTLNRTMKAGVWNTFCVPFSIDATQIASQFGEGTQIAKFEDSIDDEIQFTTLTSNEIVAGEPYIVKPINAADSYSFTNVSVAATDPITKGGGEYISFKGIYNPTDITKGLPANTFAAGIVGNVVKKAVSGSNMNGFRAFFTIPGGEGAPSSYMLKIDGTATSINTINGAEVVVDAPVYNLQGQRVDGNSLTPGIYVKAGKKFVVK